LEPLLRRLLGERTTLLLLLDGAGHVRADESQLEQVVLNLITNARDSLPQGGRVLLSTSDVKIEERTARQPELQPGEYLCISVNDDGVGIPYSAQSQIFEPFFTTRPGGTGLGLATCYGIVKQSGGHIAVESEPGAGATFRVYLPRVSAAERAASSPQPTRAGKSGSERLLLVEDEAVVRSILQRTLERAGYRVTVATNGLEALEVVERSERFDLLVTDVVMPGMSGWDLGKKLGEHWPGLPVLYISGYAEDVTKGGGVLDSGLPFLQKPFLPADLLSAIRKLLDVRA
jgi:CheY-like chemotaxis protein